MHRVLIKCNFMKRTPHLIVIINIPAIVGGDHTRVVVSTNAFHARIRVSFPGLSGLKETKMFLPHPLVKNIVGSLRDREVACSASDLKSLIFKSCVWRAVSSHSSHRSQEVILAQFSLQALCAQKWPKARFISFLFILPAILCPHPLYIPSTI